MRFATLHSFILSLSREMQKLAWHFHFSATCAKRLTATCIELCHGTIESVFLPMDTEARLFAVHHCNKSHVTPHSTHRCTTWELFIQGRRIPQNYERACSDFTYLITNMNIKIRTEGDVIFLYLLFLLLEVFMWLKRILKRNNNPSKNCKTTRQKQ